MEGPSALKNVGQRRNNNEAEENEKGVIFGKQVLV